MLAFIAAWLALNAWGSRRDRLSMARFEVTPPAGWSEQERGSAAMIIADDDQKAAQALVKKGGGLYMHFEENSPADLEYLEVIEVEEDGYPLRPDEALRAELYGSGKVMNGPTTLEVVDSRVTRFGKNDAIAARLSAKVPKVDHAPIDVRVFQYILPTDRGRVTVDCFCLVAEEAKYGPQFDAMIAGARGVAYRPAKLPFPMMVLACLGVGVVAWLVARRYLGKKPPAPLPPRARVEPTDEET